MVNFSNEKIKLVCFCILIDLHSIFQVPISIFIFFIMKEHQKIGIKIFFEIYFLSLKRKQRLHFENFDFYYST